MHLENLKVKNFKGFKHLELFDLKQVNILLGDNNVGKTSILEALLFDEEPKVFLNNLHNNILWRFNAQSSALIQKSSLFSFEKYYEYYYSKKQSKKEFEIQYRIKNSNADNLLKLSTFSSSLLHSHEIYNLKSNLVSLELNIPEEILRIQYNDDVTYSFPNYSYLKGKPSDYIPLIKSNHLYSSDLVTFFASIESSRTKRESFIEKLKIFLKEIDDIRIDATTQDYLSLSIFEKGVDGSIPLAAMGDGTIRLFRILSEIEQCRGKRLMIDEIDNGLHFSKQKEFWKVVLIAAKSNNTQLFITTHSHECLVHLQMALVETNELNYFTDELACFTLMKNLNTSNVEAFRYSFEEFDYCIRREIELRGGN